LPISIGQSNIEKNSGKVDSLHLRQRITTGRNSGHAKAFMFNEIV